MALARDVALPPGTSEDDVHASYKDGILEVRLPAGKAKKPEANRIRVSRG